ncbi:MAG: hypothetical protein IT423_23330 [Pirellulaceae bacterium]|nr:hypothetical protein [Pirellulaceae bacterium]
MDNYKWGLLHFLGLPPKYLDGGNAIYGERHLSCRLDVPTYPASIPSIGSV